MTLKGVLRHALHSGIASALGDADDERAAGGFDDIVRDDREAVDLEDAFDLHEEAVQEPEVAASDAGDGGDGLAVGEVSVIESQAELSPVPGQHEGEFVALQGAVVMGEADTAVELRSGTGAFPCPACR